jgi:hypothetical protein
MALIYTTKGDVEESLLTKTVNRIEGDDTVSILTEYVLHGEVVRLDTDVAIKPITTSSEIGNF